MRVGQVLCCEWIIIKENVPGVSGGQVWPGLSKFDMLRLSVKLKLVCGEHSFDELHLQLGL